MLECSWIKNLWKTLNDLCDENPDFNEKLEIRLSGNIDTEVLQNITQYFHLKNTGKIENKNCPLKNGHF